MVPADVVTDRFGRLLKLVQEKAAVFCAAGAGQTLEALVEEADEKRAGYVTGRLGNNLMVHFPGDASLIGSIVPVHLDTARGFYYMGTRA